MNKLKPNKSNWKRSSIDKENIIAEIKESFSEWRVVTGKSNFADFLKESFDHNCNYLDSLTYHLSEDILLIPFESKGGIVWLLSNYDEDVYITEEINMIKGDSTELGW